MVLLSRLRYAVLAAALALIASVVIAVGTSLALRASVGRSVIKPAVQARGSQSDWSCFRGPHYGVSSWDNAPVAWDGRSGAGVLWKAPLKMTGVSSPVLWGNRVFISEGDDDQRALRALDANSGEEVWRQVVADGGPGMPLPAVSDAGLALPTPACDADGVYVLFGTGDLAAFSHDGKPKWHIFLKRPEIGYGYSSSPCVSHGLVFVQFDEINGGRVLAVETASGKIQWEHPRSRGPTWSSPIIIPGAEGRPQLVVNANGSATAYDLAGKMVWDVDGVNGQVTPSPTWWDGRIYLVNSGSRLICYQLAEKPREVFQAAENLCDVSSPAIVNGLFFMTTGRGRIVCMDATSGQMVWTQKSPRCYASLVASGRRIYALGRDGTMQILAAARSYQVLGTCSLGEGADATPALGNGRIYIRGRKHLWCVGTSEGLVSR
jgi:outer membrane protein assembly factor BamB